MTTKDIKLNGTYRLKSEIFHNSVQANGQPMISADVTIVRIKFPVGRKRAWYFDRAGNAYRSSDFQRVSEVIELEVL